MKQWGAMLKKDIRMARTGESVIWVMIVVLGLLFWVVSYRSMKGAIISTAAGIMLTSFCTFYLPAYIFITLRKEWQKSSSLWLHLPVSGWSLLASKFCSGFMFFVTQLIVVYGFGLLIGHEVLQQVYSTSPQGFVVENVVSFGQFAVWLLFALLFLLYITIMWSVWAALISTAMQATKNTLKKARWLLGIAIFLIPTWGYLELNQLQFYHRLVDWGRVDIPIGFTVHMTPVVQHVPVYLGNIVFDVIVTSIVFYLSGWLLDRKVEV